MSAVTARLGLVRSGSPASGPCAGEQADAEDLPAEPPAEALALVDAAAAAAERLAERDRELHFRTDPATGRMVADVRDSRGRVMGTLSGGQALDVLSGAREI